MDPTQHYKTPFEDYSDSTRTDVLNPDEDVMVDNFKSLLTSKAKSLLQILEEKESKWIHPYDDHSVYTGSAGIAYMFYLCADYLNKPKYATKAMNLLRKCISKFKWKKEITFLTGLSGPLALGAVMFHKHGSNDESRNAICRLMSLFPDVIDERSDLPDELLNGRSGYLYAVLYVNSHISPPPIDDDVIKQIISAIIQSGSTYSKVRHYKTPLMYAWYNKEYLGAAHGLGGILYMLLQAREYLTEEQSKNYILPALHYLQDLRYPSGNFPSSLGKSQPKIDRLVQWCHGAPGMTMLYCLAYEIYGDKKFLETAIQCGEVIWKRGFLTKGYGICHGDSGNGYSFLHLFQKTKDPKYLYRACRFAQWCMDYGKHECRTPDRAYSLFEGLAGVIYFLVDMQQPDMAKFPGYTL